MQQALFNDNISRIIRNTPQARIGMCRIFITKSPNKSIAIDKIVSIKGLATALPIPIVFESRRKKIQLFLSLNSINVEEIWLWIDN